MGTAGLIEHLTGKIDTHADRTDEGGEQIPAVASQLEYALPGRQQHTVDLDQPRVVGSRPPGAVTPAARHPIPVRDTSLPVTIDRRVGPRLIDAHRIKGCQRAVHAGFGSATTVAQLPAKAGITVPPRGAIMTMPWYASCYAVYASATESTQVPPRPIRRMAEFPEPGANLDSDRLAQRVMRTPRR